MRVGEKMRTRISAIIAGAGWGGNDVVRLLP